MDHEMNGLLTQRAIRMSEGRRKRNGVEIRNICTASRGLNATKADWLLLNR